MPLVAFGNRGDGDGAAPPLRYFTKGTMRIVRFMCDQGMGWDRWLVCKHLLAPSSTLSAIFQHVFSRFCHIIHIRHLGEEASFVMRDSQCIAGDPGVHEGAGYIWVTLDERLLPKSMDRRDSDGKFTI